jgi:pimeloyl-ACP methyl ester carboxylesterase
VPLLYGQMVRHPLPDDLVRGWTDPLLTDDGVLHDLEAYLAVPPDPADLVRDTEALRDFHGDALVLWSPDNRVMPPEHGPRLAALLPAGQLVEIPGARVLSMLDDPAAVAAEMGAFLTTSTASRRT